MNMLTLNSHKSRFSSFGRINLVAGFERGTTGSVAERSTLSHHTGRHKKNAIFVGKFRNSQKFHILCQK